MVQACRVEQKFKDADWLLVAIGIADIVGDPGLRAHTNIT
jgi:hypothetical protein